MHVLEFNKALNYEKTFLIINYLIFCCKKEVANELMITFISFLPGEKNSFHIRIEQTLYERRT